MGKKVLIRLVGLVSLALVSGSVAEDIIGGKAGNGNFQVSDPFSADRVGKEVEVKRNGHGLPSVAKGAHKTKINFPDWSCERLSISGGNPSWGLEAAPGSTVMKGWPNVYFYVNSGTAKLTSKKVKDLDLAAEDVILVKFQLQSDKFFSGEKVVVPSCSGELDLGDGQKFAWPVEDASVIKEDTLLSFSREFKLTQPASETTLTLNLSTGKNNDGNSFNKTRLDNVSVSVVR